MFKLKFSDKAPPSSVLLRFSGPAVLSEIALPTKQPAPLRNQQPFPKIAPALNGFSPLHPPTPVPRRASRTSACRRRERRAKKILTAVLSFCLPDCLVRPVCLLSNPYYKTPLLNTVFPLAMQAVPCFPFSPPFEIVCPQLLSVRECFSSFILTFQAPPLSTVFPTRSAMLSSCPVLSLFAIVRHKPSPHGNVFPFILTLLRPL